MYEMKYKTPSPWLIFATNSNSLCHNSIKAYYYSSMEPEHPVYLFDTFVSSGVDGYLARKLNQTSKFGAWVCTFIVFKKCSMIML